MEVREALEAQLELQIPVWKQGRDSQSTSQKEAADRAIEVIDHLLDVYPNGVHRDIGEKTLQLFDSE